jgi:hypothetical protein
MVIGCAVQNIIKTGSWESCWAMGGICQPCCESHFAPMVTTLKNKLNSYLTIIAKRRTIKKTTKTKVDEGNYGSKVLKI